MSSFQTASGGLAERAVGPKSSLLQPLIKESNPKMSSHAQNVFEAILRYGHDEDFQPETRGNWRPTSAVAGTTQKLEVLRNRLELGVPLFHPNDNQEYVRSSTGSQTKAPAIRVVKLAHHRGTLLTE